MHKVGVRGDEVADGRHSFGNPGALVEQACGFQERGKIDLDQPRAEAHSQVFGRSKTGLGNSVAEEKLVLVARDAETQSCGNVSQFPMTEPA